MKINEIEEEDQLITGETLSHIAGIIRRDCQPFLAANPKDEILWRGVDSYGSLLTKKETQAYRTPRDLSPKAQTLVDKWFVKNTGIAFRSDHVVFGSGHRQTALVYGYPRAILPIGKFDYCWASGLRDMMTVFQRPMGVKEVSLKKRVDDAMTGAGYRFNVGLDQALSMDVEIMVRCASYYILDTMQITRSEIIPRKKKETYGLDVKVVKDYQKIMGLARHK